MLLRHPDRPGGPDGRVVLEPGGRRRSGRRASGQPRLGVLGAGTFARGVLLPHLSRRATIEAVATATGASARATAERFGARLATTDPAEVLESGDLDAVVIATRHDTHAEYAARALAAGKHVFVEKPLALDEAELRRVADAAQDAPGVLQVGFNRRFAPTALRLREALGGRGPLVVSYRVSAGRLPRNHWLHDPEQGGGRIVGEACHFVDLAAFLCGAPPVNAQATAVSGGSEPAEDDVCMTLSFADGSAASVVYAALGDPGMPKERVEVLGEAGAGTLDDFRELRLYRGDGEEVRRGRRDKGHGAECDAFLDACRNGEQPWPVEDMLAVTRATFALRAAVRGP
jgi:polar amino acid transport system substrate-binding protein